MIPRTDARPGLISFAPARMDAGRPAPNPAPEEARPGTSPARIRPDATGSDATGPGRSQGAGRHGNACMIRYENHEFKKTAKILILYIVVEAAIYRYTAQYIVFCSIWYKKTLYTAPGTWYNVHS